MTTTAPAAIDTLLADAVADGVAPGITAIACTADGVTYRGSAGSRGDGPIDTRSVVWLASMTKLITIIGVLQQVEKGTLALDQPLTEILPELADKQVLAGFDADGVEILRPARGGLTLRRLLSHTGGWAYDFWNADVARYEERHGIPGILACEYRTLENPLIADPGSAWMYGPHIEWAAKAVEKVTGLDLEQYLARHVLAPLGLTDTGFVIGDRRPRLAGMNVRTEDGGHAPLDLEVPQEPEFYMGGGGLYSTAEDYAVILRALLNGGTLDGGRILAPETVAQARTNQIGELDVVPIPTADPNSSYDVDLLPGTQRKWSLLGMLNVEESPGGRSAGSLFWAGLCNAYFWVDWERGHAGALFTQMLPFADPRILDVFDRFEDAVRELHAR